MTTVWRYRKPSVSFTTSTAREPSPIAIGPAVDPIKLPFSKTCNSIPDFTVRPPNLVPVVVAAGATGAPGAGVAAGVCAGATDAATGAVVVVPAAAVAAV